MDDLISRQAAISHVDDVPYIKEYPNVGLLWKAWIESLPTAQPEPKWIPVSERLPKSRTYCLFTVFEHDSELEATTIETVYGCFDDYGERRYWSWEDEFGECCIEGEEQLDGDHDEIIEKVLAWMPLPEPYKAIDAMRSLPSAQPEQDIEHCATCVHDEDSVEICVLRKCKYAIAELIDCYEPKQPERKKEE